MGDRQDIDALLIGALYGELESADKDRLDEHLSSHPGDRAAMDALAETRTRVRDSLARMPELDPAPAISTLILQEAARRAPRKAAAGGGVLGWFAALFQPIVRHPALAGAMALLLAGGAAGMLYKSGKVDSTEQAEATPTGAPATGAAAPKPDVAENLDRTDGYQVRLAEQDKEKAKAPPAPPDDGVVAFTDGDGKLKGKDEGAATTTFHGSNGTATKAPQGLAKAAPKATAPGYMEVTTPDRQLKQLDDQVAQNQAGNYRGAGGGATGAGSGSAGPGGSVAGDTTTLATADAPAQAPSPHTATAPAAYDKAKDAKLDEWAQVQHQHVVQLVKAGNCPDAGKVASEIAARAPEYYAAHVENDRAVRGCKQYIDQEKRKKANEEYKSRARNSFEPDMEQPAAN